MRRCQKVQYYENFESTNQKEKIVAKKMEEHLKKHLDKKISKDQKRISLLL